jgi:metallo-beta-lactamase family protein
MNRPDKKPSILFATGVGTVTGANFLLETPAGTKILIDCGMVQGEKVAGEENRERFPYDLASVHALVVTHAHLDHVGRIPKLVKEGYKGPIYSTPQTKELAELVLTDVAGILAEEARREGRDPIYTLNDVPGVFPQWKTVEYHTPTQIAPDVSIFLKEAGHILGSSMIEVTLKDQKGTKILFTGDLGNSPAPLLRDTEPVGDVDYMVMESCYGDRNHENRETRAEELEGIIKAALARGGTLVIPAFSIDRTQVLLYELNNMVEKGRLPSVPIFVDSPMGIKATDIYRSNIDLFNDAAKAQIRGGDDIFKFPRLEFTMTQGDSQGIDHMKGAKIILAGSGMSVGGRIISHEAHYLPDPKSTIMLVGYQSPGSLGRALADGVKSVHIHGEDIAVRAHIETMYGYSAHKDSDHLVEFVATAGDDAGKHKLKQVFVAMGEPGASMHLAQRLNDELGVKAMMPERLKTYELN